MFSFYLDLCCVFLFVFLNIYILFFFLLVQNTMFWNRVFFFFINYFCYYYFLISLYLLTYLFIYLFMYLFHLIHLYSFNFYNLTILLLYFLPFFFHYFFQLDLEACVWLEDYLATYKKILIVISHSQDFLNGVCTDMMVMQQQKLRCVFGVWMWIGR